MTLLKATNPHSSQVILFFLPNNWWAQEGNLLLLQRQRSSILNKATSSLMLLSLSPKLEATFNLIFLLNKTWAIVSWSWKPKETHYIFDDGPVCEEPESTGITKDVRYHGVIFQAGGLRTSQFILYLPCHSPHFQGLFSSSYKQPTVLEIFLTLHVLFEIRDLF